MKPEDEVAALRALHRRASSQVDAAPDPSVRAAVLAAAARAVDAKPGSADAAAAAPFGRRRWPVSMAALLVVSLMTGLVVNQAMRDEPERVTSAAAPPAPMAPAQPPALATPPDNGGTTAVAGPEPGRPQARSTGAVAKPERPRADHGHALDRFARDAASDSPAKDAAAAKIVTTPLPEAAPARAPQAAPAPSSKARAAAPSVAESAADEAATPARASPALNAAQRIRRGPEPLTPEAWVERIVKLREGGDGAAADREVEALHTRYPDFEIPAAALGPTGTR